MCNTILTGKQFLLVLLIFGLACTDLTAQWIDSGNSILGIEGNTALGNQAIKLSGDGKICILQVESENPDQTLKSEVKVFELIDEGWRQKGQSISFGQASRTVGFSVAISDDGNTIALSDPHSPELKIIAIYSWTGNEWAQKGRTFLADNASHLPGCTLDLSADGNILLVADCNYQIYPVRAYRFVDNDWVLIQDGVFEDTFFETLNASAALSADGTTVVVGDAFGNETKVFRLVNDQWEQIGQPINGDEPGDTFGHKVAISDDGTTIAISTFHMRIDNCQDGYVRVYELIAENWWQKGRSFNVQAGANCDIQNFANGLGLSGDGNTIVIGQPEKDGAFADVGWFFISEYTGEEWVGVGLFVGSSFDDMLGKQLAISSDGRTVAGVSSYGSGVGGGEVQFFQSVPPENDEACNAIRLPPNGFPRSGSTLGSTASEMEQILANDVNSLRRTVWFTFEAPQTGMVSISTCGETTFDTQLTAFSATDCGDYNSFINIGYNDDAEVPCLILVHSILELDGLTPGQDYYIMVDGWNIDQGDFEITVTTTFPDCDNPAIDFDGVDDHVDIGPNQGNFGAGDFTFEMMVKTAQTVDSPANSHIPLASKREGCGCEKNFWYLSLLPGGKVVMELFPDDCGQGFSYRSQTIINDDNWHHVMFTRERNFYSLYVDGVLEHSEEFIGIDLINNAASLQLGSSGCTEAGFGGIFKGQMDEVRTWNYARSIHELNRSRNLEMDGSEQGLTAYYNFNDGKPGEDNTDRIGSIDLAGSESVARLIAFDRNGTNSNWVAGTTGIIQLDRDEDGLYDACNEPDDLPTATRFAEIPGVYLGQNYPNPTAGEVAIPITLGGQHDAAELRFTSVMGRTVKVHKVPRGTDQDEKVQVSDLPVGIYFYSLFIGDRLAGTKRMVIAR